MRPSNLARQNTSYFRCKASQRGYAPCGQGYARVDEIDEQLVETLSTLEIPDRVIDRIDHVVAVRDGNAEYLKRISELEEMVERVEYSWEQGFLDQETYLVRRRELQHEIESLRPVDHDDLIEAADLLRNFRSYWDACAKVENPAQARRELVSRIVQSVYVYDRTLVAVVFYSDYAVVLGENETAPAQVTRAAFAHVAAHGLIGDSAYSQSGDDGVRLLLRTRSTYYHRSERGGRCRARRGLFKLPDCKGQVRQIHAGLATSIVLRPPTSGRETELACTMATRQHMQKDSDHYFRP